MLPCSVSMCAFIVLPVMSERTALIGNSCFDMPIWQTFLIFWCDELIISCLIGVFNLMRYSSDDLSLDKFCKMELLNCSRLQSLDFQATTFINSNHFEWFQDSISHLRPSQAYFMQFVVSKIKAWLLSNLS